MTIQTDVAEQAKESLDEMLQDQAEILEADWIGRGRPVDADGLKQYRGLAQIEAELYAEQAGEA